MSRTRNSAGAMSLATQRAERQAEKNREQGALLLLRARNAAGLTQAELAYRLCISQSTVSKYEAGALSPTLDFLGRWLFECGGSLDLNIGRQKKAARPVLARLHGMGVKA